LEPLADKNAEQPVAADGPLRGPPLNRSVSVTAMSMKQVCYRTAPIVLAFVVCCSTSCDRATRPAPAGATPWSSPPTLSELAHSLASPTYENRRAVTNHLWEVGHSRALNDEEVRLMLPPIHSDPDWRIKVRCIQNLPLAENKNLVVPVLIAALSTRDEASSGDGNVQLYACRALAEIGDRRALPPMRDWLEFLEANPNMYIAMRDTLLKRTRTRIQELETTFGR
jgi:hypothetical protein